MSAQQSCLIRDLVELVDKHRATSDLFEIFGALEVLKSCYLHALREQLDAGLNNEEQGDAER